MKMFRWLIPFVASTLFFAVAHNENNNQLYNLDSSILKVKRDTNDENFKEFLNGMTKAARVITGIALQTGIGNGTIPLGNTVAELLNVGGLSMEEILSYDKKPIEDFLNKLDALLAGLENMENSKIEEDFGVIQKIKEDSEKVGDLTKMPSEADFNKLTGAKSSVTEKLKKFPIRNALFHLKLAVKSPEKADQTELNKIKDELMKVNTELTGFKTAVKVDEVEGFLKSLDAFSKFAELAELLDKISRSFALAQVGNKQAIAATIKSVEELAALPKMNLSTIQSVLSNRFGWTHFDRITTPGLVNGFTDASTMFSDCKDEWVKKVFGKEIDMVALEEMARLKVLTEPIDKKWKTSLKPEMLDHLKKLESVQTLINTVQSASADVEPMITVFQQLMIATINGVANLISAKNSIVGLKKKLEAVKEISKEFKQEQVTKFASLGDKTKTADIKKVYEFIQKLSPHFQAMKGGDSIQKMADSLYNEKKIVTEFNGANKVGMRATADVFEKLKATDSKTGKVASAIKLLAELRELKKDTTFGPNIKSILSSLLNVKAEFDAVKQFELHLKTGGYSGEDQIKKYENVKKDAKPFGDAVNALILLNSILEKKNVFEEFFNSGNDVDAYILKVPDDKIALEITQKWGELDSAAQKVNTMMTQLESKKTVVGKVERMNDVGYIFTNLTGLSDCDVEFGSQLEALSLLIQKLTDQPTITAATTLKQKVEDLAKLDLKFARFNGAMSGMPVTLGHLQAVLAERQENYEKGEEVADADMDKYVRTHFYYIGDEKFDQFFFWFVMAFVVVALSFFLCIAYKARKAKAHGKKRKGGKKKGKTTGKKGGTKTGKKGKGKEKGKAKGKGKKRKTSDESSSISRTSGGMDIEEPTFEDYHPTVEVSTVERRVCAGRK